MNNKFFSRYAACKNGRKSNFRYVKISLTEISKYICFTSLAYIILYSYF